MGHVTAMGVRQATWKCKRPPWDQGNQAREGVDTFDETTIYDGCFHLVPVVVRRQL